MGHSDMCSLINLLEINGIDPQKVRALVSSYRKPSEIFSLSTKEICEVEGVELKTARSIQNVKNHDFGLSEVEKADKLGAKLITFWDDDYPFLLRKIYDPPVLLYQTGKPLK